eukprot:TRINITY_DN725_c0_g7_i1.p2 TRINITY_DN725_c0_g7~~TRINITY_DN725_c0_g7_i1.p2  ORF type:complete len:758 (-),score=154.09 TRINITY_DN725_c0_g7_i1:3869-6142(-)
MTNAEHLTSIATATMVLLLCWPFSLNDLSSSVSAGCHSLQTQLREKEIEHIAVLEHLKKLEQENNELASKIDSIEKGQTEILNENQQLKKEIEDLRRASLGVEFIQREKELEADIDYYSKEIKILQAQLAEQEKIKQQEISRLQDELYILQAKLKKAATLEAVSGQQKKQIEELLENEEIFKKELLKVATAEEQVKMLEKRNKELETKNIALMSEYYEDKNRVLNMEAELKKTLNNCSKVEKELKKTKETTRFWEQKAKQSENDIKQLQEELDSYRLVSGAGCLLTQEKEASYQAEITKLRKQVTDIISSTEEKVKVRALELEAKLEVSLAEKDRLTQELVLAGQRRDELEKDNEDLLNKIANCKRTEELASNLVTDLNRTKKDRDLLLDVSKRAQNALAEQEKMRAKINKTKEECIRLQSLLTKCESEKTLVEAELKEMCDKNLKLEKELARNEEKIAQMEQEKKKLESSFQNQARHIEMETEKKMSQLFKSEFETARLKYKEKIKDYKTQISEKDKNLSKAYEEVRTTEAKYTETLKRFKEEYERSIKSLNERIAQEKENAKRGIREIAETSKREEQLLSTAIYEISGIINQLMKDKHKGLTATAAQKMLNKLADVSSFRSSIGSQGESDNKDRTLKENQSFKQLQSHYINNSLSECTTLSLNQHYLVPLVLILPLIGTLSTFLMTPTATVCFMSRTANLPNGGYSLKASTHIGRIGTIFTIAESLALRNCGLVSISLLVLLSSLALSSANLQAM